MLLPKQENIVMKNRIKPSKKLNKMIGERLRAIRTELLGLTAREMAVELGLMSEVSISYFERGKRKPSMRTCNSYIKLAATMGQKIDYEWLRPDQFD